MFLIPIGHEETSVRRLPWITFGVMIACLAALVLSGGASLSSRHDEQVYERFEEAIEFFFEHPYLELDPEFQKLAMAESGGDFEEMQEFFGSTYERPDKTTVRAEQEQLDRLVARCLESLDTHPYMRFGLIPKEFSLLGLLTHMFMHAGWIHLLGNMLILYLAGPYIEDVWGRPLYCAFYLGAGIVAALAFVARQPELEVPLVGASGAIAGVMGAFLVRYWKTRIRFFYMVGVFIRGTFWAPAWLMLPLWLVEQLFMAALTDNLQGQGGVAYTAHIGGFAFGAGAAWLIRSKSIEERYLNPAIEQKVSATVIDNSAVDQALALHEKGQGDRALQMLAAEVRRHPSNRDAAMAMWSVALDVDRPAEAGPAMLRLIQEELRTGDRSEALNHWKEVSGRLPELKIPPALCARLAQALAGDNDRAQATMMLRRALLEAGSSLDPAAALQIARVGKSIDRTTATTALRLASAKPDLDPEIRGQIDRLLAELAPAPLSEA